METATLITPFWFKQRQCKAEFVEADLYRITGPNLPESFLGVRQLPDGKYQGYFRSQKDGPDAADTQEKFVSPFDAWEGAFELYRQLMIL
jgi:hypothetical protein